jgi:hypothetical protein
MVQPLTFLLDSFACRGHSWFNQLFDPSEQDAMRSREDALRFCVPEQPRFENFNDRANIPYGVSAKDIFQAMIDFTDFLQTANTALALKSMERLEDMLMPANFSSMVGEFITSNLPKHCSTVVKNTYHNGHPDLLPAGKYVTNAAQHAGSDGIEIKASRYLKGWQGHNQEDAWLMVFVFESGRPSDAAKGRAMACFRFLAVYGGPLNKADWKFDGRGLTSRRTITATVLPSGFEKMTKNWIYKAPGSEIES